MAIQAQMIFQVRGEDEREGKQSEENRGERDFDVCISAYVCASRCVCMPVCVCECVRISTCVPVPVRARVCVCVFNTFEVGTAPHVAAAWAALHPGAAAWEEWCVPAAATTRTPAQ